MTKNMDWINLYRLALKEPDAEKRVARVEEAESAMKQVLRMAVEEGDSMAQARARNRRGF